jgi:hypothetical protein
MGMRFSKLQKIALLVALLILIAGLSYAYNFFKELPREKRSSQEPGETTSMVLPEEELTVLCPFEGLPLPYEEELYKPVAVIFDNHLSALPHRGISDACIVFETLAEGGITRILAIYSHRKPKEVGPVRSARIYFVDIALSYSALLAHCGGSPDALSALRKLPIDLDQIRFSEPYYRIRDRRAPHNLIGNLDRMHALAKKLKYDLKPIEEPYFSFERMSQETTPVKEVVVPFPSKSYYVTWKFDDTEGSFTRFTKKGAYIDELTQKPVKIKNLIVLKAPMRTRDEKGRLDIYIQGKGQAFFFIEGIYKKGIWKKESRKPFVFLDESGEEIRLSPGLTWVEIIPSNLQPTFR